jgi:hypothetical protein
VNDYPAAITAVNHVEPVPRRIRAFLAGQTVLDAIRALYVWEWGAYHTNRLRRSPAAG